MIVTTLTTHGIKITVESFYEGQHSEPARSRYLHVYNIRIDNRNNFAVQLLRRKWEIIEGDGKHNIVEGDGVIGEQPEIASAGFHAYSSYAILAQDIGLMRGTYTLMRTDSQEEITAQIPEFLLVFPPKLN